MPSNGGQHFSGRFASLISPRKSDVKILKVGIVSIQTMLVTAIPLKQG